MTVLYISPLLTEKKFGNFSISKALRLVDNIDFMNKSTVITTTITLAFHVSGIFFA